jgi:hypothetical protein
MHCTLIDLPGGPKLAASPTPPQAVAQSQPPKPGAQSLQSALDVLPTEAVVVPGRGHGWQGAAMFPCSTLLYVPAHDTRVYSTGV